MADYYVDLDGNLTKKKKKKKNNAPAYTVDFDGNIAPVKTTVTTSKKEDDSKLDFFQKGAFEDGYQFGDVTKSILGTTGDAVVGVAKGIGSLGEGIVDLGKYGVAGVADVIGKDKYAEQVRKKAQENSVEEFFKGADDYLDQYSVLGRTSDAVMQGLGQVGGIILTGGVVGALGAGAMGATVATSGLMGLSSAGSGMSEAYQGGATDKEATIYGISKGIIDAGSELIFGGLGKAVNAVGLSKGISSLDDAFAKKLSSKISNQVAKNFAEFGVKASAEGFEEVLAGLGTAVAKYFTYMDEEKLGQIVKDENLLEQFVVGTVTSGMIQSGYIPKTAQGSLKEANETGRDFITGYTQNEQAVIDKEVENRIKAKETNGKKLTNKEITTIEEAVKKDLDKGYIDIDTIESALGGETYNKYKSITEQETKLQEEYDTLHKMKRGDMTGEQIDRETEVKNLLEELKSKDEKTQIKEQLSKEVQELSKIDRLSESYNEKSRRSQAFEADLTKYDAKQQEVVKKAVESGILNNTNRTHEFVDMVAKISADKGVSFDFTNNAKLKESGFALEGKTVNGYLKDGNIAVNIDSAKALNTVVGHEITHVLEGTEFYTELQNVVKAYATTKGEYDTRYEALKELYKDIKDANIENEVTADLVGEYLFTDSDFVSRLSVEQPNIFKKIYEEIKYLVKVATGSKEARQLEDLKRAFDKAYKASSNTGKTTDYHISSTFADEIDKTLNNTMDKSSQVKARDFTPKILVENGVKDLPMLITQRHVKTTIYTEEEAKKLGLPTGGKNHYHGLGKDLLIKSIDSMDNPLEIYKQDADHYLIITEMKNSNGDNVIIPIKIDGRGTYNDVYIDENQISSVYGKRNLEQYLAKNNFENIYKKRETALNEGFQLPNISDSSKESIAQNPENASGKSAKTGDYRVYGKDIALEAPVQESLTVQEESLPIEEKSLTNKSESLPVEYAPLTEAEANERDAMQGDRTYQDVPPEVEAPYYGEESPVEVDSPFDAKDMKEVGDRKQKAYMYENPEVKPFFQQEAEVMLAELRNSIKGEKHFNDQLYYDTNGEQGWFGTKRETSEQIAYLLDEFKYTYKDIEKGLKAIIEDNGKENNAISKRIEFMLDERLREGYTDFTSDQDLPPNQDYIRLLEEKQITDYTDESWNNWLSSLAETEPPEQVSTEIEAPVDKIVPAQRYEAIEPRQPIEPQRVYSEGEEGQWERNKMARADKPPREEGKKQRKWIKTSTESDVVNREILPDDLDQSKINYQPISNKQTLNGANARLGVLGYEKAVSYFEGKIADKKTTLEDIALGERLIQEAMKKGDTKTAGELIQDVAILGTELGQKVQALSIIQRMTPEGQLRMLQKTVNRGKAKGDKVFEGVEITQELIDRILKTYNKDGTFDQDKLNQAVEDVKQQIAKQMKVTTMEKVNAWRYLAMLGNPKTHIRNLVSNVAMYATTEIKNSVARTTEEIAPVKNRTKTWAKATKDVREFAKQETENAKTVLTSENSYSDATSIKAKREIFKNKILQKVYDFNGDLMTKEDWWFKKPVYRRSLQEYLTANGIKTQDDIQKNTKVVEKAKLYALEQAQIATFQQYSWLSNKITEIEHKNAVTQIAVGSILPFKKTPINIAKAGLSYSPLGFTKSLTYDLYQMKKGNMEASQVIDNLAKGVTGSALTYIGYMLAMSGLLNGGGDDDKEGKYDYQLGKQSYSVNFGGSTYSLNWLSPVAMPLFVGANAYEMLEKGEELSFDTTSQALAQTLDPMSEMSFLSSLDSVLSSYDSGMAKFAGIGETMMQNYVTQFVPTLSSQVATVMDDKKRSTKASADSGFKIGEETLNKLMYKIPVLRETLEPSTDIWGNEVKQTENVFSRAMETFIAPYARKDSIATEIDAELKDLYAETGDNGILPNIPYNYVNYKGEKYEMSAKEHTDIKKTYGQTANDLLEDLFKTTTYQNSTSEDKADMVNKVYDYAWDEAKKEYLNKEGVKYTNAKRDNVPYYKENSIKGAIENDMTVEEFDLFANNPEKYAFSKAVGGYSAYKSYQKALGDISADKDENGKTINGSRKEKVLSYINGLDADYYEKIILFKSEYNADDTYNNEIIEYLNSRSDISYEEEVEILKGLGFEVDADGNIYW